MVSEGKRLTHAADEPGQAVAISAHVPGHYVFGSWRNVLVTYWLEQANGPAVKELVSACSDLVTAHPGGISIVHMVREGAGLPDAPARQALARMGDRYANETACLAIVLMGAGFWASALQSVLTGIRLLAPPRPSIMRFSRDLNELESWFPLEHQRRSGVRLDTAGLLAALQSVRHVGDNRVPAIAIAAP